MPRVYTGGTFDMFHPGHIELLKWCRKFAGDGEVAVGLNTDAFVSQYKRQPIMPYEDRFEMLQSCIYVDIVIENTSGADSKPTIEIIKPDIICIGMDWLEKDYCKQMGFDAQWLNKNNINLVYVPRTTRWSTTNIKEIILE